MSSKVAGRISAHYVLLIRSFTVIFAGIAVWWGIAGFAVFWQQSSTGRIASRIVAGEAFKRETLNKQLPILDAAENSHFCLPSAARNAAIIRLRNVEDLISSGIKSHLDEQLISLRNSIRTSLSCSPADPFLWLIYYWVQSTQYDRASEQLKYLRMSYRLGPNEGWIALKRNRVAFAIFERLPADLAKYAINEFVGLLETSLYEQAAEIFTGPAWRVRNIILPHLRLIDDERRELFAKAVRRRGFDVDLPRIDRPERRPWQRN